MAERKRAVHYTVWTHSPREPGLTVWCDARGEELLEIEGVIGVWRDVFGVGISSVFRSPNAPRWSVHTDPRYDAAEVGEELVRKFSVQIPDAFKDCLEDT